MSLTAAALRVMASKGLTLQDVIEIAEAMAQPLIDEQAERRRAKDRERARVRRQSADNPQTPPAQSEEQFSSSEPPENNQTLPPISPKISQKVVSLDFERFWEAYPRKVGKGASRSAYAKASRKADSARILAGLEQARANWRELEPQFIPHPATWLNQERWLDEPDDRATGPPKAVRDDDFAARALEHFRRARALDG